MSPSRATFKPIVALVLSVASVASLAACTQSVDPSGDGAEQSSEGALRIAPPVGTGTGTPVLAPPRTYAPPVNPPTSFQTGGATSNSALITWQEAANPETIVWRQKYDINGNALGAPTAIKTFYNLPTGFISFTDSAATTDDHSSPDPDRQTCYQVQEENDGCDYTPGGYSCDWTPWSCVYTKASVPYNPGRIQMRLKTSSIATAEGKSDHVSVSLGSGNMTWLDSTQVDFAAGSNITYDLLPAGINDRSDIDFISIQTPDSDGLCINEIELLLDNTTTYFQSFGSDGQQCQWVWESNTLNGNEIFIPFASLRTNPAWQSFAPPNLVVPASLGSPRSFVGYRAPELLASLDSIWGDTLRNPANGYSSDAGLRDGYPTTANWISKTRLHVQQHILASDGTFGATYADPSYDLAIHNDSSCAPKNWCVKVENADPGSDYEGWLNIIPFVDIAIDFGVQDYANGKIQKAMNAMGGDSLNDPPNGTEYCFANATSAIFSSEGFGTGSFTLCF